MKTFPQKPGRRSEWGGIQVVAGRRASRADRKLGIAIISVLGILSLVTVMLLSLLASAHSEMKQASTGEAALRTRQFNDMAVAIAIGQIRQGTQKRDGGGWSSQPGAIRRYLPSGNSGEIFKLYSDAEMVTDDFATFDRDLTEIADWKNYPAKFVDMNEPILQEEVLDESGNAEMGTFFPIMDPRAKSMVEGFNYDFTNVPGGVMPVRSRDGNAHDPNARLPMPVEWLYVLKDGTVGHLDESNHFVGAKTPTRENPMVGRVAFWADDETCKINVNTASDPTHWSVPRNVSNGEIDYARYQPAQNEFQRYPGHPATTSLGPVLHPDTSLTPEQKEALYEILPRIPVGGSESGTKVTNNDFGPLSTEQTRLPLFASLDELYLATDRIPNDTTLIQLSKLKRAEAFLTAHSRAPELNLFGLPRVSIWPVNDNSDDSPRSYRTAFDNLIAFCSTLGQASGRSPAPAYVVQRRNADSSSEDYSSIIRNRQLYDYLLKMTSNPIPGFGNSTFASKYGADHQQILTQIFDYIRCVNLYDDNHPIPEGVNKQNFTTFTDFRVPNQRFRVTEGHGQVVPLKIGQTRGFGRFYTITEAGFAVICCADADYPASNQVDSNSENWPTNPSLDGEQLEDGEIRIQPLFLLEAYCAAHGYTILADHYTTTVKGLTSLKINDQPLYTQDTMSKTFRNNMDDGFHSQRLWGGTNGFRNATFPQLAGNPITVPKDGIMSFSGGTITVEISSPETSPAEVVQTIILEFPPTSLPKPKLVTTGAPFSEITQSGFGSASTSEDQWWTFDRGLINSNGSRRPSRLSERGRCPFYPWTPQNSPGLNLKERYGARRGAIIYSEEHDVVRTIVPLHGDYRLIAARSHIPAGVFAPMEDYFSTRAMHSHILNHNPAGSHWTPGFGADDLDRQLVPGANYHFGKLPDFPPGAVQTTGDFDSGNAVTQDGAYINKPDEGNNHRRPDNSTGPYGKEFAPYFDQDWNHEAIGRTYFSPNRIICSPVFFGSLPTGVMRNIPWQTLLFRPQKDHPNDTGVPDYTLLDLFWMPVVDPWAISGPSSSAGKVNLNHQIVPFSYIERTTALRGVLDSAEVTAIPKTAGNYYKTYLVEAAYQVPNTPPRADSYNHKVNADETLKQFKEKFASGKVFRTGAEICDLHLVPEGTSLDSMRDGTFWSNHGLTGDNSRERPYSYIHPRVTARSNTFRVHVRTQAISKARSSDPAVFDPDRDEITAEYRGSTVIERYLHPEDEEIQDYAASIESFLDTANQDVTRPEDLYSFRVVNQKRFNPN